MSNCPCKGCEKRFLSCHSSCEEYMSWQKAKRDKNAEIRKIKEQGNVHGEDFERKIWKKLKGGRK